MQQAHIGSSGLVTGIRFNFGPEGEDNSVAGWHFDGLGRRLDPDRGSTEGGWSYTFLGSDLMVTSAYGTTVLTNAKKQKTLSTTILLLETTQDLKSDLEMVARILLPPVTEKIGSGSMTSSSIVRVRSESQTSLLRM